uniref:DDE Tnp4 domain-containing protein n=1 Tax=Aegilops tauschii subsp. strangulata TaxID=200361 RepID=A0A453H4L6_AEGTS
MLGSIDCMHWKWKNFPTAHKGFFVGHKRVPTVILEAVASQDLWIWHSFFGLPGSHNDINVLHRSPVLPNLVEGHAPEVNYTINGHNYNTGYYLADGIYPQWETFVKQFQTQKVRSTKISPGFKKHLGRMSNEPLVFCKLALLLYVDRQGIGIWRHSEK